jgi:hypothetical protein
MSCQFLRVQHEDPDGSVSTVDIDDMSNAELDALDAHIVGTIRDDILWTWVKGLARWIRDHREKTCLICRIIACADRQPFGVTTHLLAAASAIRCQCPGTKHEPLAQHPHTRDGCKGYATITPQGASHG